MKAARQDRYWLLTDTNEGETEGCEALEEYFNRPDGKPRRELVELASQIQWILATQCAGPTSTCVRRKTAGNAFESWRQLDQRYKNPAKAKAVERLSQIMEPNFWNKNFEDNLPNWEGDTLKYEKETVYFLTGDAKIAIMMNNTTRALQERERLNAINQKK